MLFTHCQTRLVLFRPFALGISKVSVKIHDVEPFHCKEISENKMSVVMMAGFIFQVIYSCTRVRVWLSKHP